MSELTLNNLDLFIPLLCSRIAFYDDFLGTQRDFAIAIFLLTPRKSPWKAISGSRKS